MPFYVKRPVRIEARQFTDSESGIGIINWVGKDAYIDPGTGALMIRTREGDMIASLGDQVIKGIDGEFYPCKPDIFEKSYDEVPDWGPADNA